MKVNKIKIAAIQETKLNDSSSLPDLGEFILIRKDRQTDAGGGLAFIVHNSIQYQKLPDTPPDLHIETAGIKIADITIINVYVPPVTSCTPGYNPDFSRILSHSDAIIMGDFNAHDSLWHSTIKDSRGEKLSEDISNSNFGTLNCDKPTRLPTSGQPTSPDISLASHSLLPVIDWDVITSLNSDHLPIVLTMQADFQEQYSNRKTFVNFNKADWGTFTSLTEEEFSKLDEPLNVYEGEKRFRKIINKVSNLCIPQGRIKTVYPEVPREAATLIKERDEIRANDPTSENIKILNEEISDLVINHRREKWKQEVEKVERSCSAKLFKLLKRINGKSQETGNQPIKFKGKYISNPSKIAKQFNKQYSSVVHHKSSKESRKITKNVRKNNLDDHPVHTAEQTKEAIKKSKSSKALGPDKISNLHLKHLGPNGISYLTKIFNHSSSTCQIPAIWKSSIIIPLLKPGKDPDDSKSYRPVSLLCPAIKVLERILLPTLTSNLELPDFQHGFRSDHSTVTALYDFTEAVAQGFNKPLPPDRTILVQLDLSKAFDMVSLDKLITDLNASTLPEGVKRWLNCYLKGRQSRVQFRSKKSASTNIRRTPRCCYITPTLQLLPGQASIPTNRYKDYSIC